MPNISIARLLELAPKKLPEHSVLLRGDHGIGKSQIVRQLALQISKLEGMPFPVIDRRVSQMTEGDMIGLPKIVESKAGNQQTTFAPPDWFMQAVERPALLFLDEINRGDQSILQACFQV